MTSDKRIELLRKNNDKLMKQVYDLESEKKNLEQRLEIEEQKNNNNDLNILQAEWEQSISDLKTAKEKYNTLNYKTMEIKSILSGIKIPFYKRILFKILRKMGR